MSEFVFLFRSGDEEHRAAMGSPKQAEVTMKKWIAWIKELGEKGQLLNPGQPLERVGKVVKGRQKLVTDGPYAESKDIVGGFMLVQARDLAHAAEISTGCPIFENGGLVEVRPVIKLDL